MSSNLCLDIKNHENKRVIFTEAQRLLKCPKRPELRDNNFINGKMKEAILSPRFIYQDLTMTRKRQAVYLMEFKINNKFKYTKIILEKRSAHFFVITAYRPDYVKERGYLIAAEKVEVVKAKLGEYAPMVGAAMFYHDDSFKYMGKE